MRPGNIAAIVLVAIVIVFAGYSYITSDRIKEDAVTSGTSARPQDPGSIQDLPATNKSKPPLIDSNVPPAGDGK